MVARFQLRLACFDNADEWDAWLAYNKLSHSPVTPCHDCTKAYQRAMLAAGRCENPTVIFVRRNGETMGLLPHQVFATDEVVGE